MTLNEFVNVDNYLRDKSTGEEVEQRDYMGRIIGKLGIENIKPYLPYSIDHLKKFYKGDEHFNNTYLSVWDCSAEYLKRFLIRNGITIMSLSERVCILKETARILCEREKESNKCSHIL